MEDKNTLYIELGANLASDKPTRNIIKPFSEEVIKSFREAYKNVDVFRSVYFYDKAEIREAKQAGALYFDLDGEYAKDDLTALSKFLIDQRCPKESIQVYYSGNKGFHLEIPWEALAIDSEQQLNKIYEVIVKTIKDSIHASSIDTGIYDKVRLWRLSNSINPKSGLHKIPLTLDEVELPLGDIKELAKKTRLDFQFSEPIIWGGFKPIFQKAKKQALNIKRSGIFEPTEEGQRNDATFKRALKLKAEGKTIEEAIEICSQIEDEPQLPLCEIKRTVASAYQEKYTVNDKEKTENENNSQALQVIKLVAESDAALFHDQFNAAHLAPYGDGRSILKIGSKKCDQWVTYLYWKSTNSPLNPTTLTTISHMLEARACFEGPQHHLYSRMAELDKEIWYDLGDGLTVQVTQDGWSIINTPPILFRSFSHQKTQVEPKRGGDINELLDFINLSRNQDGSLSQDQLLLLCWVVFAFVPSLPHPAPVVHGPQGSNKSTFLKVLKELIDPSAVQAQTTPNGATEFIQVSSHHWFLVLDNLSHLPEWLSDVICRVITGGGYSKRELYSNDDDVIYDFKHLVGLNGITLIVDRADLLDRSLIFGLKRTNSFKTEKTFWTEFEERKSWILGGIFDVLVKSIKLMAVTSEPKGAWRMADFAHWGGAISQALGFSTEDFLKAYQTNIDQQNQEAIDSSPIAVAITEFMSDQDKWLGTPTELLGELEKLMEKLHINKNDKLWPKDARWVWRRIMQVLPNLEMQGIKANQGRDKQRIITLQKVKEVDDSNDDTDNISTDTVVHQETGEENEELPF